jgi:fructokinase
MVAREGRLLGGIEAGGTKFICAIGPDPLTIEAQIRIPTTTPDEMIAAAIRFFREAGLGTLPDAIGIASFGPVALDKADPEWGHILATTKPGWSQTDLAGAFSREFGVPIAFETDVNGAALGELRHGAGIGLKHLAYVTVGTGIGGGIIVDGRLVQGRTHPEIGHIRPRRHRMDLEFPGSCPFHGDCLEGLASGSAIMKRCGAPLHQLPADHPMWLIEPDYLAQLAAMLVLSVSPQRIVFGGGVLEAEGLLDRIGPLLTDELGGYVSGIGAEIASGRLLAPPGLGSRSGITGALVLAEAALA